MSGELIQGPPDAVFDGAALDSRRVLGGELFFALSGEQTDGHRFVASAFERGAAGAVIEVGAQFEQVSSGSLIRVEDAFQALHELTRWVRTQVPQVLVGISGSAGKTTTKEYLVHLLAPRPHVAGSPGNLNNLYGFPMALLGIPDDTEWMIAEMGMSTPGELAGVSELGRPDIAVLLNVRLAHLEGFQREDESAGLEAIAEAKAGLFAGLAKGGVIVANAADPEVVRVTERHRIERDPTVTVVWFAAEESGAPAQRELGLAASRIEPLHDGRAGSRLLLTDCIDAEPVQIPVELPVHGSVNVENFVAAAACARVLGLGLDEVVARAGSLAPSSGRGEIVTTASGLTVIDDSYNANPDATVRALEAALNLAGNRHLCVLGEMLELGRDAASLHREVGAVAAGLGYELVLGVGELARHLVEAAEGAEGAGETHWVADADAARAWLAPRLEAGDVVLVKGSRGVGLERVVEALTADSAPAGQEGA